MNILIVDGNDKIASDKYRKLGMDTQYEVYKNNLIKRKLLLEQRTEKTVKLIFSN